MSQRQVDITLEIMPGIHLVLDRVAARQLPIKSPRPRLWHPHVIAKIMNLPFRHIPRGQIPLETLQISHTRGNLARRRYSIELLDHAVALAKEIGPANAARITGVERTSISRHLAALRIVRGEGVAGGHGKWTLEQKRACAALALRFMAVRGPGANRGRCWLDAGRRLKMNGRSIQVMFERGLFDLGLDKTPPPAGI